MSRSTPNESGRSEAVTFVDSPTTQTRRLGRLFESNTTATPTSRRALHAEEAARTHAFSGVLAILAAIALVFVPFQTLAVWLTVLMGGSLASLVALCGWVWHRSGSPATYNVRVFRVFVGGCAAASLVIVYYGGVFSSAPVALVLGLSFFPLGEDRRFVNIAAAATIAGYLGLAVGVAVEIIPQHSLIVPGFLSPQAEVFAIAVTGTCLVVTVWHARLARAATQDAIEKLSSALVEVQQREALIHEAHQQLDDALNVDAGKRGRHSGQRAGAYLLGELIGRGAMGEVYEGRIDSGSDRVAVKVLSEIVGGRVASLDRFHREARIASQLTSPNVVQIIDVGATAEGAPYIAMELLIGHDLAWHLRHQRRLPAQEVLELIEQVASGLEVAHQAGVIHRDIKPNNLFYDTRGTPAWKILDFGVARDRHSSGTLTRGAIIGTPGYMSPEQAEGRPADHRSDVFSLAGVAYRSLTGQPAFSGVNPPATVYNVVHRQPTRPSLLIHLGEQRAAAIDAVFAVALAKNPVDRIASARELSSALGAASRGNIDAELHERADSIIASAPWGAKLPRR